MSFLNAEQKELAAEIARILTERRETVAVAEATTGGLVSAALLSVAGASAYFRGGGILYTLISRNRLAGIPEAQMTGYRGPTTDVILSLADGLRERLDATWGIGESGIAGPTGSRYGHPVGYTTIAVVGPVRRAEAIETGLADREANMIEFTTRTLRLFLDALRSSDK